MKTKTLGFIGGGRTIISMVLFIHELRGVNINLTHL